MVNRVSLIFNYYIVHGELTQTITYVWTLSCAMCNALATSTLMNVRTKTFSIELSFAFSIEIPITAKISVLSKLTK